TIAKNEKIVPLGTVADIRAGIITGDNQRFYSKKLRYTTDTPVIKSPREIKAYTIRKRDCVWWLPTENIPFTVRHAPILWPDLRGRRHFVVHNPENLAYEHTFYGVTPRSGSTEALALILNSIWVNLLLEIYGRTGLGGGAIRMVKRDLIHLPIPDPRRFSWESEHYRLLDLPIGATPTSLDRKIDKIILCELGLENRWDEMQYHVNYFIEQRQARAKNQTHG
ncbi:MAG: hypothetical protein GXO90_01200, partial [FCB group bacterium]|nr:hypothetical protein [FCB group bacterium]